MAHAVEHRQDHGVAADCRRHVVERRLERERLHGQQHGIEGLLQGVRRDELGRKRHVAVRADDAQPLLAQRRRACGPHQEGHVAPGLRQASAEVPAGRAGTHHQDAHAMSPSSDRRSPAARPACICHSPMHVRRQDAAGVPSGGSRMTSIGRVQILRPRRRIALRRRTTTGALTRRRPAPSSRRPRPRLAGRPRRRHLPRLPHPPQRQRPALPRRGAVDHRRGAAARRPRAS